MQHDTIEVRFLPAPSVELGKDTVITEGQSITLDAGQASSYRWSNGASTRTITVSETGSYSVSVSNGSGCASSDNITVLVVPVAGVDKNFNTESYELRIQPNPFDREVQIALTMKKPLDYTIEIYDIASRKVTTVGSGAGSMGLMEFTVNGHELSARDAFYLLKLTVDGKSSIFKLMRRQ